MFVEQRKKGKPKTNRNQHAFEYFRQWWWNAIANLSCKSRVNLVEFQICWKLFLTIYSLKLNYEGKKRWNDEFRENRWYIRALFTLSIEICLNQFWTQFIYIVVEKCWLWRKCNNGKISIANTPTCNKINMKFLNGRSVDVLIALHNILMYKKTHFSCQMLLQT